MFSKDSAKSLGGVFDREERWEREREREKSKSSVYQKSPLLLEKSELKVTAEEINLLSSTHFLRLTFT